MKPIYLDTRTVETPEYSEARFSITLSFGGERIAADRRVTRKPRWAQISLRVGRWYRRWTIHRGLFLPFGAIRRSLWGES